MSISTLIGSRLLSGIAAFAISGSLLGGTAIASQPDSPVREIRHEVRDQSKAQRDEIKQLRAEFAAEYAKERPDTAKLERLHASIEAKRDEINALRFAALMQMHDELDAEQRARMAEKLAGEGKGKGKGHAKHGDDVGAADGTAEQPERGPETADKGERDKAKKGKRDKAEKGKRDKADKV